MNLTNKRQLAKGFSLVELLIAMTLGLFLIAGMIAVFSGSKRSSDLNTAMANIQENARFAVDAMSRRARMAGYQGCLPKNANTLVSHTPNTPTTNLYRTATMGAVVVNDTSWSPGPPPQMDLPLSIKPVPGTHVLTLMGGTGAIGKLKKEQLSGSILNASAELLVAGDNRDLFEGATAIVSDCSSTEVFQITGVTKVGGNTSVAHAAGASNTQAAFTRPYGGLAGKTLRETRVMRLTSDVYFVGDSGLKNQNNDPVYSLYVQSYPYDEDDNPPIELVQGVENMRVSFGIERNDTVQFVTPDSAQFDPERVDSIRIGLLMASYDRIAPQDDGTTYVLAGQEIPASGNSTDGSTHPKDRRFRLAFNTTIKIRNSRF